MEKIRLVFKTYNVIKKDITFENNDISQLLTILLNDDKEYNLSQLVPIARDYITNDCRKYLSYYITEIQNTTSVQVDNVILLFPKKRKQSILLKLLQLVVTVQELVNY